MPFDPVNDIWHNQRGYNRQGILVEDPESNYLEHQLYHDGFGPDGWSLDLNLCGPTLDSRITFTRASVGTRIASTGRMEQISAGNPRFEFDPQTKLAKGLLIEESRTNLLTNANQVGTWNAPGGTYTAPSDDFFAKDVATLRRLTEGNTVNGWYLSSGTNVDWVAGTTYCISAYFKAEAAGRYFGIVVTPSVFGVTIVGAFDPYTGSAVITSGAGAGVSCAMEYFADGWWRCWLVAPATVTITNNVVQYRITNTTANGAASYQGDGVSSILQAAPQTEVGTFPTTFIPTLGGAVTRAVDLAVISGASFSSWFTQGVGTVVSEAQLTRPVTTTPLVYSFSDGTFNNSIYRNFDINGLTNRGSNVLLAGVGQAASITTFTGFSPGQFVWDACAFAQDSFAESCGGQPTSEDLSGTPPVVDRLVIGSNWGAGGGNPLNGTIRRLTYYPLRLSNLALQALSKYGPPSA